uniref:Cytochrome-b5 reductase n=1 Tax=Eutreptiella gymnastica TaxID=73025 RepID=A0A7S1NMS0_9EUGL|mmetsp:Transcript_62916/g.112219  ORF Transcript_62916/g.112219 Transcript_62916/m.112219 type:complete len:466 (+) Transcript_62916:48-1445(+)
MNGDSSEFDPVMSKAYVKRHNLHAIIDDLVIDLAEQQPKDPFTYMISWLQQKAQPGGTSCASTAPPASSTLPSIVVSSSSDASHQTPARVESKFTMSIVQQHNTPEDCWIVLEGKIYNVTEWLKEHPGGAESILDYAGKDATEIFKTTHSAYAKDLLAMFYLGEVVAPAKPSPERRGSVARSERRKSIIEVDDPSQGPIGQASATPSLTPTQSRRKSQSCGGMSKTEYRNFTLEEVRPETHDTRIFRFNLLNKEETLGARLISHISIRVLDKKGEEQIRSYTPIASGKGWFDIMVKRYPNATVSSHIFNLMIGSTLQCQGPFSSKFTFESGKFTELCMLAAGTGITPMLQIIKNLVKQIVKQKTSPMRVTLLCWNRREEDILHRHPLEMYTSEYAKYITVCFFLTKPPDSKYPLQGRVNPKQLSQRLPPPGPKTHVLVAGPPGFCCECTEHLESINFSSDMFTVL